jgi:hypothetical protein
MNATGDGHSSDGTDMVRLLRKSRFLQPQDSTEFKSQSGDLPVFLVAPRSPSEPSEGYPFEEARIQGLGSLSFDALAASLAKNWIALRDRLARTSLPFRWGRPPPEIEERALSIALGLLLVPLSIVFLADRMPLLVKAPPPAFLLEDRLTFGRGLGDRLTSQGPALNLEQSIGPTKEVHDGMRPHAEAKQSSTTLTKSAVGTPESPPMVTDERQWSLPFDSMNYAIEDLPTTPEASFRTEITISTIMNEIIKEPAIVTAKNDNPVIARAPRPRRKAERRKQGPVQIRVVRLESLPPAVQAAILKQQAAAAPLPFPFLLGAPPPPSDTPAPKENAPPKKPIFFPQSIHDIFKNEY